MPDRAICIVPGCCNSSAKWAGHRYICGPHWRPIPKAVKREHRRLWREYDKVKNLWPAKVARAAYFDFTHQWGNACEPAAIEAAAGV